MLTQVESAMAAMHALKGTGKPSPKCTRVTAISCPATANHLSLTDVCNRSPPSPSMARRSSLRAREGAVIGELDTVLACGAPCLTAACAEIAGVTITVL